MNGSEVKVLSPEQKQCQALLDQAAKDIKPLEQQLKNIRRDQAFDLDFTPPGMPKQPGPGISEDKAKELTAAIEQIKTDVSQKVEKLTANLPLEAKDETRGKLSKWLYPHGCNEIETTKLKQPDEAFKSAFIQRYDKRVGREIERSLSKDVDTSQEMLLDTLKAGKEIEPQKWDIDKVQIGFLASKATFTDKLRQQEPSPKREQGKSDKVVNDEKENRVPEVLKQGYDARQKAWQELQAEHTAVKSYYQEHIKEPLPTATEKRMAKQIVAFEQKWDGKKPEKTLSEIKTLTADEMKNDFFSGRDMTRAHNIIEAHYGHPEKVPDSANERMGIEVREFYKEVDDYKASKETVPAQDQDVTDGAEKPISMSNTFFQSLGFDLPGDGGGGAGSGPKMDLEPDNDLDR